MSSVTTQAKQQTPDSPGEWVEVLARVGYAALGVVYFTIGILAFQAAIGSGGATEGSSGALSTLITQPFGRVLLTIVAVGLLGYAIWQFVRASVDPENEGDDTKGMVKRAGYAASGVGYLFLAGVAAQLVLSGGSSGGGGGGSSTQDWTARVLSWPFGQWLVGIGGAIVVGAGLYQIYKGYDEKFKEKLKLGEMNSTTRTWAVRAGKFGFIARGIVFAIIGIFFIVAAWQQDPQEAGGIGEALSTLAGQPYGPWLLGLVALGLILFGIFCFVQARYRRILVR